MKRRELITSLLRQYINPNGTRLITGACCIVAERINNNKPDDWDVVTADSVYYLWKRYRKSILAPEIHKHDISHKKGAGRRLIISTVELYRMVKEVPLSERQTVCSLAFKIGVKKSTLHDSLKKGLLSQTTSSIKPFLTPQNMEARVAYCLSFVDEDNNFSDLFSELTLTKNGFILRRLTPTT